MINKIIFLTVTTLMLSMQSISAGNNPEISIRKEITNMIKEDVLQYLKTNNQDEVSMKIQFIVTDDKQIRLVAVTSADNDIIELVSEILELAQLEQEGVFNKFHYNLTINFIRKS